MHAANGHDPLPKMYTELAPWWPLLSAPADYAEEANFFKKQLLEACAVPPRTLLELGSGGGNNASHLKAHFALTLVDRSPAMLAVSRALNPECAHLQGDMRTLRLDERFDIVFIHDAVMYLTTPAALRAAIETATYHCKAGGVVLFAPDCVRETYTPYTQHGGHDGAGRSLRYLEWTHPPVADTYAVDFAYALREGDGPVRVLHERHTFGLFSRAVWLKLLQQAGFEAKRVRDPDGRDVFVGVKLG